MKGLCPWVLGPTVEVHWPLNFLKESLPPPLLWVVLAQASTSTLMEGASKPLFWPGRVVATLHTAKGFGELSPSALALML
jgi:hypothetical protein